MERIQVLIEKLQQQKQQNDSFAQMLVTVQLLQNELLALQQNNKVLGTSKVAVVLPNANVQAPINYKPEETYQSKAEKPVVTQMKLIDEAEIKPAPASQAVPQAPPKEEYKIQKPAPVSEPVQEPVHAMHPSIYDKHFEVEEAPTLIQQQIHKEINELISHPRESLNDKLKQPKKEVAHALKEVPIKDLRKAIGVNDKFTLINELFRGDEAMYERSIKTINGFHILAEAEYWMNRELKVKLGWDDNKEIVQHFYQLVRRRFS